MCEDVFDMNDLENQNHAKAFCAGLLVGSKDSNSKLGITYIEYVVTELMSNAGMIK